MQMILTLKQNLYLTRGVSMKEKTRLIATLTAVIMCLSGCSAVAAPIPEPANIDTIPQDTIDSVISVADSLYEDMKQEGENTFISPTSVYLAFGMLYNGAKGETAEQLQSYFGYNSDLAQHNGECKYLYDYLTGIGKDTKLDIANSVWVDSKFFDSLNKDFIDYNELYFNAKADAKDFANPDTAVEINQWVSDNTGGMIKQVVDQLSGDDLMALFNCIYFNGQWESRFEESDTSDDIFHGSNGDQTVKFMHKQADMDYYEDDQIQSVRLPYKDCNMSMILMLPKENQTIEHPFSREALGKVTLGYSEQEIALSMPKLNIEYSDNGELMRALKDGGVTNIFNTDADLSGISNSEDLYVHDTVHKTALIVDEEGTEASAVTGAIIKSMSLLLTPEVNFNRPFYLAIVDNDSGMPIFCGNIAKF